MKQDTLTTAKRWWAALEYNHQYRLSIKHLGMLPNTLNEDGVFAVYEAEHPEQSLPSKEEPIKEQSSNRGEGDILEGITPGGWMLNKSKLIIYARIKDNGEPPLCTVHFDNGWGVSREQAEANARLIANAPKLFEENKRLKERIEVLENALRGVIKVADRKTDEFDKAKAALNNNNPE